MKLILIYIVITVSLMGCESRNAPRYLIDNNIINTPYFSLSLPIKNWYITGKEWNENSSTVWKALYNKLIGRGSLEITIHVLTSGASMTSIDLFSSTTNFELGYQDEKEKFRKKQLKKIWRHLNYYEFETQYFQKMKCVGKVFSRDYRGVDLSSGSKKYFLKCGYYHKKKGKAELYISYRYYQAPASASDLIQPKSEIGLTQRPPVNEAEQVLKHDFEKLLNKLVIKDVDWERMEKEGLLHDKPYKTISW